MMTLNDTGIVLRRSRHLENDMRMTVFLRDHGKVSLVSKGSVHLTSKLKAVQEPFSEADFQIYISPQGTHGRLTGGKLIRSHELLRRRFEAYVVACISCEVVETLIPFRAPSPEVFDILRSTLKSVQEAKDARLEWVSFVVKLLKSLGHGDLSLRIGTISLEKQMNTVWEELERILPWRLKSDLSALAPLPAV